MRIIWNTILPFFTFICPVLAESSSDGILQKAADIAPEKNLETITLPMKQLQLKIKVGLEKKIIEAGELSKVTLTVFKDKNIIEDLDIRLYLNKQRQPLEKINDKYIGLISQNTPGNALLNVQVRLLTSGLFESSPNIPIKVLPPSKTMNPGFPIIAFWDALSPNEKTGIPAREKVAEMDAYVEKSLENLKSQHFNAVWSAVPCSTFLDKVKKYGMKATVGGAPGKELIMNNLDKVKFKIPSPTVNAVKISKAPSIDGNLDDPCWAAANPIEDFILLGAANMASEKTKVYVAYDEQNLYIAFKCAESKTSKMTQTIKQRDNAVWRDDSVEVLLDVNNDRKEFSHLIVNSLNTQMDSKHKDQNEYTGWDASGWHSAVSVGDKIWVAEMSIPFNALGVKTPKTGDCWGFNLAREAPSHSEFSSWAPNYQNLIDPRMFGSLIFSDTTKNNLPGVTVSGKVADTAGTPIKNSIVTIDRFVCLTDAEGNFKFSLIPAGEYEIEVGDIRHELQKCKIKLTENRVFSFTLDESNYLTLGINDTYNSIQKSLALYSKYRDAILGYYLIDEPPSSVADNLALINKIYKGLDPQIPALSCYLGLPAIKTLCNKANPPLLLIDVYPLLADSPIGDFKMRGHFLNDMEMTKYIDAARESTKSRTLWVTLPAFSSVWPENGKPRFRMPTPKEMRAMVYLAVAHGAKGIAYFIYESVPSKESIVGLRGPDGKFGDVWKEVGKINEELEQIAPILLNLNFDENIATASKDTDIQTFSDAIGSKYLIVVNKDVINSKNVTISINIPQKEKITKIIEISQSKTISPTLHDKTASFEYLMGPGEGRLFKLE